ncbi:hydrolethalus syndrome protein 1 [Chiroxiphia lanceolata]|uniref:hydrolethalus syndrome protein 1 n=1 Tax=Chiroxiphia lanceolata TaxID=296741 RepID=UPI0013CF3E44|nr:hydrolethalus syndrome protein 1 [Chiroxiphia lanceolata]
MEGTSGAWGGGSEELARPRDDPYADASIVCGAQADLPVLSEDQRQNRKLVMKRKVLRHRPDGMAEIFDESVDNEPGCSAEPRCGAELWNTGRSRVFMEDTISEGEISSEDLEECMPCDEEWFLEDSPCSLLEDLGRRSMSRHSARVGSPTSYILPQVGRRKRTDPVAKFHGYRQDWERYSFPGEDPHDDLRWAMRRQMAQPGEPRRAPKRLVPNTYVVPTTKQRDALRFGVRRDLAQCLMPRKDAS